MADKDFYVHEHAQNAGFDENVVLASSLLDRVDGQGGTSHEREGIERAVGSVMAPYKAPTLRPHAKPDTALCSEEGCRAYPMKAHGVCYAHASSMGLLAPKSEAPSAAE